MVMKQSKKGMYIRFILVQSAIYGLGNPLTKIAYESITPFWCLAVRFTAAFIIFMILFGRRVVVQLRAAPLMQYLPASVCMAVAYISCNLAFQWTSAMNVGFLMSLPVLFAPAFAVVILKSRYNLWHIPIQLAVVAGLYLLGSGEGTFSLGKGDWLALLTSVALAAALVFSEKSLRQMDAIAVSTAQIGLTAVLCLFFAFCFEDIKILTQVQPVAWAIVAYFVLFCTCISYLFQNVALTGLSSAAVSLLQCTEPLFTAIASFLILGETLAPLGMAGAAIILACVLIENILALREQRRLH